MTASSDRKKLVDVAAGRLAPTMIIRNVRVANVLSREIHDANILVYRDRIAAVLPLDIAVPTIDDEIDGKGLVAVPGLIDPHLHTESSAVSLAEFARAVVPRGVATIICDPHEYGNVLGRRGIELLLEEAKDIPLTVKLRVPPRVPEMASDLETNGGTLSYEDTLDLLDLPEAACLAGDINPEFFLGNDPRHADLIAATIDRRKTVSGYAAGLVGRRLNAYVASGAEDTHVAATALEAIDDIRHGLTVFLPLRNAWATELPRLAAYVAATGADTRRICLCTDDIPADRLIAQGHMDARFREAVVAGFDPLVALQMATINPATEMRIDRDHGSISAGKFADIVLLDDFASFSVIDAIYHGRHVVADRRYVAPPSRFRVPGWAKDTINLTGPIDPQSLVIDAPAGANTVECNAVYRNGLKEMRRVVLPVIDGMVACDDDQDVVHVAVLDRYAGSGRVGKSFALNTGIRRGALASTVNHNAHNIFVLGRDADDMALAVDHLIKMGGGYAVACDGEIVGEVRLPVIGMISEEPLEVVAEEFVSAERAVIDILGCEGKDQPLLTLSFLCAPVVPFFGVTDMGVLNTRTFEIEDALVS